MLENKFYTLCQKFTNNHNLIKTLWSEISVSYSTKNRHYHTLSHLESIYNQLEPFKLTSTLEFSIFYHDIIYRVQEKDNEEKSALLARKQLIKLGVPIQTIKKVYKLIVATHNHKVSSVDYSLFLDADLSILGSELEVYKIYIKNIRKEYFIYSDKEYKEGRRKILEKFLEKDRIYISNYFYTRYEQKAQKNIKSELESLSIKS